MKTELHWIDVSDNLAKREQPVHLFDRPKVGTGNPGSSVIPSHRTGRTGVFWVPLNTITDGEPVKLACTRQGDHVRVPVNAYRVPFRANASLVAVGIEIGLRAAMALKEEDMRLNIIETRIIMGHEVHEMENNTWRCYIGIALRTE